MDLIVFGFNDWHDWAHNGFCTRSAITTLKLSQHPAVDRVLVVSSASSVWVNIARSLGALVGRPKRPGTTLKPYSVEPVADGVWAVDHSRFVPREESFPAAYRLNGRLHDARLRQRIVQTAADLGMRDVVLWIANPLMAKHLGTMGEDVSVFDAIDDWSRHPQKAGMREPILAGYTRAAASADVVFTVSRSLSAWLGEGRGDVRCIPNGVDAERFSDDLEAPAELEGLPRPLIGYVGSLQERVDQEALLAVARRLPDASIVLVGPLVTPSHFAEVRRMPNVHLLGPQSGARVPAFVNAFDVCILPHVDNTFTRSMDPMKLYEYLAAGKPVVATGPVDDSVRGLIHHASTPDDFASAVEAALSDHDAALAEKRRAFARSKSWDGVVDEMLSNVRDVRQRRAGTVMSA